MDQEFTRTLSSVMSIFDNDNIEAYQALQRRYSHVILMYDAKIDYQKIHTNDLITLSFQLDNVQLFKEGILELKRKKYITAMVSLATIKANNNDFTPIQTSPVLYVDLLKEIIMPRYDVRVGNNITNDMIHNGLFDIVEVIESVILCYDQLQQFDLVLKKYPHILDRVSFKVLYYKLKLKEITVADVNKFWYIVCSNGIDVNIIERSKELPDGYSLKYEDGMVVMI